MGLPGYNDRAAMAAHGRRVAAWDTPNPARAGVTGANPENAIRSNNRRGRRARRPAHMASSGPDHPGKWHKFNGLPVIDGGMRASPRVRRTADASTLLTSLLPIATAIGSNPDTGASGRRRATSRLLRPGWLKAPLLSPIPGHTVSPESERASGCGNRYQICMESILNLICENSRPLDTPDLRRGMTHFIWGTLQPSCPCSTRASTPWVRRYKRSIPAGD